MCKNILHRVFVLFTVDYFRREEFLKFEKFKVLSLKFSGRIFKFRWGRPKWGGRDNL